MQQKKLELADGVLTGAKKIQSNKLTLEDLKTLFSMDDSKKGTNNVNVKFEAKPEGIE